MKEYLIKKAILAVVYVVMAIAVEMITFTLMKLGVMPYYAALDIILILGLAFLVFAFPYTVPSVVIMTIVLSAQVLISITNVNLYMLYGDIFSMDLLDFAGEVGSVFNSSFFNFWLLLIFIPFPLLFAAIGAGLCYKLKDNFSFRRKSVLMLCFMLMFTVLVTPITYSAALATLYVDTENEFPLTANDKELYDEIKHKISFFYKFGTYPLYFKNIILAQSVGIVPKATAEEVTEYMKAGMGTMEKNQHFGVDEDNNLIVVLLESVDEFLFDEKYTPNLYNLRESGISFTNFYTQAKTDFSEASLILGSYPSAINLTSPFWVGSNWKENQTNKAITGDFDFSVPNLLKKHGFDTVNYFHPNYAHFYSRKYTHPLYGFDGAYFIDDYPTNAKYPAYTEYTDITWNVSEKWCLPERWFLDAAIEEFMPTDKRFCSYFTSINSHGGYTSLFGDVAKENRRLINDDDFEDIKNKAYFNTFKNALAKTMVLDDGIGYLLEQLNTRKSDVDGRPLAESTTIVFFTDHYAYSDNLTHNMKGKSNSQSPVYRIPSFIVSPTLKNLQVDKFMTHFDLVPTMLQLLGIEYNPNLYLGKDAFSTGEIVVDSKIGGVFNDKYYTLDGIEIQWEAPTAQTVDFIEFQNNYIAFEQKRYYIDGLYVNELDMDEFII